MRRGEVREVRTKRNPLYGKPNKVYRVSVMKRRKGVAAQGYAYGYPSFRTARTSLVELLNPENAPVLKLVPRCSKKSRRSRLSESVQM